METWCDYEGLSLLPAFRRQGQQVLEFTSLPQRHRCQPWDCSTEPFFQRSPFLITCGQHRGFWCFRRQCLQMIGCCGKLRQRGEEEKIRPEEDRAWRVGSENTETSLAEKPLMECQGSMACNKNHRVIAVLLLLSVILESRYV